MTRFEQERDAILSVWPEAEEVERLTGGTKFFLGRDAQKRDTYRLVSATGALFYAEKGTGILTDLKDLVVDEKAEGFDSKCEEFAYTVKMRDDGSRIFFPRADVIDEYIEFARPQALVKRSYTPIEWTKPMVRTDAGVSWFGNGVELRVVTDINRLKVSLVYDSPDLVPPVRLAFTLVGLSREGRTIISKRQQIAVGTLPAAMVFADGVPKGEGQKSIVTETLTDSGMDISVDVSKLFGPVEIDPTYTIATGNDDGHYDDTAEAYSFSQTGTNGYFGMTPGTRSCWLRYTLTIPNAATISAASIDFTQGSDTDSTAVSVNIKGEVASDPTAPTSNSNARSRTRGSASVNWQPGGWTSPGNIETSPDISSVIQEIVNQAGFVNGNHAQILIDRVNSGATAYRTWRTYDNSPSTAPILSVTYSTASFTPFIIVM